MYFGGPLFLLPPRSARVGWRDTVGARAGRAYLSNFNVIGAHISTIYGIALVCDYEEENQRHLIELLRTRQRLYYTVNLDAGS